MACTASTPPQRRRPILEIADVLRAHGQAYRLGHAVSYDQHRAIDAIVSCRTEALGGHLDICDACGHSAPSYNSCRNRHCPKCQSLSQARWIDERKQRILPTHYFHVVFTLPSALRPIARRNSRRVYDLLFETACRTLLDLGRDPRHLGGQLGITAVLHTWTRKLEFHPHLHCIVTGGALSFTEEQWLSAKRRFLFPVKVLSRLFRGKFLDALCRAFDAGDLEIPSHTPFPEILNELYKQEWVVYAKRPFGGPTQVFSYLGRYTHRVGISNQRLRSLDQQGVRFATKNGQEITLPVEEFIGRFLQHILPSGFVKIRHFGLLASGNVNTRLAAAHRLLANAPPVPAPTAPASPERKLTWKELLFALTGTDVARCPVCKLGAMASYPLARRSDSS